MEDPRKAHVPIIAVTANAFEEDQNRTAILEQFRREAEAHIVTNDVVISLGCTDCHPGEGRSLRELFERADERMYENKKHLKKPGAVTRL